MKEILNIISIIVLTIIIIIIGIKMYKIYEQTSKKEIEVKEEIKNYYRRKK